MSGRETVRAFRETGSFVAKPPPSSPSPWLKAILYGLAAAAVCIIAVVAFIFLVPIVPQKTIGPLTENVALDFGAVKAQDANVEALRNGPRLAIKGAELTRAENSACGAAAKAAGNAAFNRQRTKRELSGSHLETYSQTAAEDAARIACVAATRPLHLCDANERDSFIFEVQAQSDQYDRAQKLVAMSDDDLLALKQKDPSLSPIALKTLRLDLNDMNAAVTRSLADSKAVVHQLTAAGIIPVSMFRGANGYGALWSTYMQMIDGAQDGPNACAPSG